MAKWLELRHENMKEKLKKLAAKLAIENGPFGQSKPFLYWYRLALLKIRDSEKNEHRD